MQSKQAVDYLLIYPQWLRLLSVNNLFSENYIFILLHLIYTHSFVFHIPEHSSSFPNLKE